tara:strand:+ start:556 stop:759 length:204 start_codon:yes stop_codon:yes gene_type:complete
MYIEYTIKNEYGKTIVPKSTYHILGKTQEEKERSLLDSFEEIHTSVFQTDFSDKSIEIEDAYELSED